jgi:hypothetical protein
MLHAYVQKFDVTVTMQNFLALFGTKHRLCPEGDTDRTLQIAGVIIARKANKMHAEE